MKPKILIIEDRRDMAELIRHHLEKEGYIATSSADGGEALELIQKEKFDLILLDLMLPKVSGIEILKRIKQEESTKKIPVIIESAKSEDEDVILGLELGAEDYVTKPFSPKVLLARIQKVLSRHSSTGNESINFNNGDLTINTNNREVRVKGKLIILTMAEFGILVSLVNNQNKIMTRDKILEEVWQNKSIVVDRVIDVHMNSLRKKLGSASCNLQTIRGVGYMFKTKGD
jgi:two-component system alkaline phosphatase synthesis response regulator PhoP